MLITHYRLFNRNFYREMPVVTDMEMLTKSHLREQEKMSMRPEIALLLCCARVRVDRQNAEQITVLAQQNLDWDFLIQLAIKHGVLPLLYTHLKAIGSAAIPTAALDSLHQLFHRIAQRNMLLAGELVRVLNCLGKHEIVAVPYKGPVLASLVYGNIALRPSSDLDIIVQQQDILKVKQLLMVLGYRPKLDMTHAQEITYLNSKTEHTYDFFHPENQTTIELHWRIEPEYSTVIELKHFWHNLELTDFASTGIVSLPLEDWLPILCVHASRHIWERLMWICDIAELLQAQPRINWQKIIWQTNQLGCKRIVLVGLYLTHRLLGTHLPPEIMQKIAADRQAKLLASKIYSNLIQGIDTDQEFLGTTSYHIQVRERFQDKIFYCQSFLPWLMQRYR